MRTAGQVVAGAANGDRARAGGLGRGHLVLLAVARQRLAAGEPLSDLQPGLVAAASHPAAVLFDALLARRLSAARPTVWSWPG